MGISKTPLFCHVVFVGIFSTDFIGTAKCDIIREIFYDLSYDPDISDFAKNINVQKQKRRKSLIKQDLRKAKSIF
jgi:hypothetical protein